MWVGKLYEVGEQVSLVALVSTPLLWEIDIGISSSKKLDYMGIDSHAPEMNVRGFCVVMHIGRKMIVFT